jgi:hypothetical protein
LARYINSAGGGRGKTSMLAVLLACLAALLAALALAPQAKAELSAVGPVNPDTGFPFWYEDANGLRLDLCLDGPPNCLAAPADLVAPEGEAFWWQAESTAGPGLLVLAQEAAYIGDGAGQEMAFSRIRFVARSGLEPGATYTVTHPYGTDTYTANDEGAVPANRGTEDIGCEVAPCDFGLATTSRLGPFLTWDTFGHPELGTPPPAGFVGDAATEHKVVGSPLGTNFFRIEGPGVNTEPTDACPTVDGPISDCVESDLFTVQGKIHGVTAFANPKGGTFNTNQSVSLTASDPAAQIRYTTDPALTDADIATSGTVFDPANPILMSTPANSSMTRTLRYLAIDPATGEPSSLLKQTYTIDKAAPTAPSVDLVAASDTGSSSVDNVTSDTTPTFAGTTEAGSSVELFEGTTKVGSAKADATGNYSITTSSALVDGEHPITAQATDAAGNKSAKSAPHSVAVDTTAPVIPSGSLRPLPGSLSSDATPDIKAKVKDAQSNLAKSNIKLSIDTVPAAFNYNRATDLLSATSRALAPGLHNARIVATDAAGNQSIKRWSFKVARR